MWENTHHKPMKIDYLIAEMIALSDLSFQHVEELGLFQIMYWKAENILRILFEENFTIKCRRKQKKLAKFWDNFLSIRYLVWFFIRSVIVILKHVMVLPNILYEKICRFEGRNS